MRLVKRICLGLLLFALLFAGQPARAQDDPRLLDLVLAKFGQKVDLKDDPALRDALYGRGLITKRTQKVTVDRDLVDRVVGSERLLNDERKVRYHVGDGVFIKLDGAPKYAAKITAINSDGTYTVEYETQGDYDYNTGEYAKNKVVKKVSHATLDRMNGVVDREGDYLVNGYVDGSYEKNVDIVSVEKDDALRAVVDKANAKVDKLIASGRLDPTLPADPKERARALKKLTKTQAKLVKDIVNDNRMAYDFPDSFTGFMVGMKRMVGRYFDAAMGKCTAQSMAITAVLREIGRRAGFDARALRGNGHSITSVRLADGSRYLIDPSGMALGWGDELALMPLEQWNAEHDVAFFPDNVRKADRTEFTSPEDREKLARGYSDADVKKILAAEAADQLGNSQSDKKKKAVADDVVKDALSSGRFTVDGSIPNLRRGVVTLLDRGFGRNPSQTDGILGILRERTTDGTRIDATER